MVESESSDAAEAVIRSIRKKNELLSRGVISPNEAANAILDTLAYSQQFHIVPTVADLLPPAVHQQLRMIIDELIQPGARLRTFDGQRFTPEEKAVFDQQMHSQFVQVGIIFCQYWANLEAG